MKLRYREQTVNDGDEIDVGENPLALSIHTDRDKRYQSYVAWLEPISFETLEKYKARIKKLEEGGLGK